MGGIRYLVVSDMHAGAELSLATPVDRDGVLTDADTPSPVAASFGVAVRALMERQKSAASAQVILLGDIMDLAFCDRKDAARCYVGWLKGLIGDAPGLFAPDTVFLPGNHDHSLWTAARMAAEVATLEAGGAGGMAFATPLPPRKGLPSALVTALNRSAGLAGSARLHYPNFALHDVTLGRCVAFHHGHFLETTYRAMSLLHDMLTGVARLHLTAAEIADENANWIDFGWSSFGQTSSLSRDVVTLYSGLSVSSEAHHLRQRMARSLSAALAPKLPIGGHDRMKALLRQAILAALDASFGAFSDEERASIAKVLSESGVAGLRAYVDGPLAQQLRAELGHIPPNLTFIFGHTHKPFVDTLVPERGPVIQLCNTGGWYLDSPRLNGREGVSLVVMDDALNVVSLRCFATPINGMAAGMEVRLVSAPSPDGQIFAAKLEADVAADAALWADLSQVAAREYHKRQNLLLAMLSKADHAAHVAGGVI